MSNQNTTPIEDAEKAEGQPAEGIDTPETVDGSTSESSAESAESTAFMQQALAATQKKADEYFQGWQRERADFSNYKKRAERDLLTMRFNAKIDTLKTLLPVLDDFERAMASLPEDLRDHSWLEGVRGIQRKLIKTLEDEGVQAVDPTGEAFDPNLHEAIGHESSSEIESGHITTTLQKGYVCGDRVLRPALVRVAE
ncbi:MAG: nucleotide exchange factor GrpE [Anaerolineae bacterium]|nr:nucleotide exchange factor GrpE [Anaerolineae bacterium]